MSASTSGEGVMDSVSVVVCAKDRETLIGDTLRSVVASRPHEIIVIDDQSTDGTAAVARQFTDRVIPSEGKGLAGARQLGAEHARGRYVAYVDSDAVLSEGCLATLTQFLESDSSIAVASAALRPASLDSYWERADHEVRTLTRDQSPGDTRTLGASACVIRRDLLLEFRFDPFFVGAGEDADLARRLRAAGWRLYRGNVTVRHHVRSTLWTLFQQRLWYGRGAARLAVRHAEAMPAGQGRGSPSEYGLPLLLRILRERRYHLIPFVLVSGIAYRLGTHLERRRLHRLTAT